MGAALQIQGTYKDNSARWRRRFFFLFFCSSLLPVTCLQEFWEKQKVKYKVRTARLCQQNLCDTRIKQPFISKPTSILSFFDAMGLGAYF